MKNFTNPLDNLKIASPCSQDWEAMIGNDRKRFCGECKLNVYNLSGMTKTEAENLLANSEGRLCVRFFRREDGTVLTENCPVGWARVKRRMSKTATAFASLLFGLLTSIGVTSLFNQPKETFLGELGAYPAATPTPKIKTPPLMGEIAPVKTPTPKPTPKKEDETEKGNSVAPVMGRVSISKSKNQISATSF